MMGKKTSFRLIPGSLSEGLGLLPESAPALAFSSAETRN